MLHAGFLALGCGFLPLDSGFLLWSPDPLSRNCFGGGTKPLYVESRITVLGKETTVLGNGISVLGNETIVLGNECNSL